MQQPMADSRIVTSGARTPRPRLAGPSFKETRGRGVRAPFLNRPGQRTVVWSLTLACALAATIARADTATNYSLTSLQRLERPHLQAAHEARLQFQRERRPPLSHGVYEDFRAIIHAHAEDAEHTK